MNWGKKSTGALEKGGSFLTFSWRASVIVPLLSRVALNRFFVAGVAETLPDVQTTSAAGGVDAAGLLLTFLREPFSETLMNSQSGLRIP